MSAKKFHHRCLTKSEYIFHKNNQYLKRLLTIQQTVNYAVYLNLHSSSCTQMFFKIDVLKNFAMFVGKHLCWSFFFNNVAGPQGCNFIKKRLRHRCFPVNVAKFLRTRFFTEHLRWLLQDLFSKWKTSFSVIQSDFVRRATLIFINLIDPPQKNLSETNYRIKG